MKKTFDPDREPLFESNTHLAFSMLRARFAAATPDHRGRRSAEISIKRGALTGVDIGDGPQLLGAFPVARSYRWVADLFRRERLVGARQVLVPSTAAITPASGMTLEGDDKHEISWDFTPVEAKVGKSTAFRKVTDETIEDFAAFSGWMKSEFVRQLLGNVDDQILNGDGNRPGILGLLNWTPAISTAGSLKAAVAKVIGYGYQPTGIAMSPDDFTTAADVDPINWKGTLFGLPVVASEHVQDGAAIVGDFSAATIHELHPPRFQLTNADEDNFIQGLVTVRSETSFVLAVPAPAAFCVVSGS